MKICEQDWLKDLEQRENMALLPLVRPTLTVDTLMKDAMTNMLQIQGLVSKPCFYYLK